MSRYLQALSCPASWRAVPAASRLRLAVLITALAISGDTATSYAQEQYPAREIHLICGFAAGGGADVMYRYFAEKLRVLSGKPVIVENKPGVQGALALTQLAKSKPDGYTVSLNGGTGVASALQRLKAPGFELKDVDSLTGILEQSWVLIVSANSPLMTLSELTAHLKAKGSKASYGTATTVGTVVAERYKAIAQLEAVQVNYKTIADTLNDLASGSLDFVMADTGFTIGQVSKGTVRALALSTARRAQFMPGVPTMDEGGVPGIDVSVWWSLLVPAGTPTAATDKLDGWFAEIATMPETAKFLANNGVDVLIATPAQTKARQEQDVKNWAEYLRLAKIEPM
jgi:tripartite-type tricarboxylate transporter receptor subunit TctC